MRQIVSSRNYSRTIKSILLFLMFLTIFFLFLWESSSILKVRKILIEGYEDKIILRGLSSYYEKNILFVSSKNLVKNLLEENPHLRSIRVQKVFPNLLKLSIETQPIIASLEMNDGYGYLSNEGKIIKKGRQKNTSLPLIRYYQKLSYTAYNAGDEISYIDIVSSLYFLQKLKQLGLQTDTIDISGPDMLLFNLGAKKIYFSSVRSKETQNYELEQIVRQFKIGGIDFKTLDLRFDKPVIVF